MRSPALSLLLRKGELRDPRRLGNTAAWYDINDVSSLRNDAGAVPGNSDTIKLIGDKSGNSATNALVLNGVAGNYASAPDSAAVSVTGDIDLRVWVALPDWTPAAAVAVLAKRSGAPSITFDLQIITGGLIFLGYSIDGSTYLSVQSTSSIGAADFAGLWIRATRASATGAVLFYTSSNGSSWTQLGDPVAGTSGALFDSTALVEVGANRGGANNLLSGLIYRAQIYNGIDGTLVFDANFTTVPKLATSFTESSPAAATVTINTTGDLGARISGARDLVQMTSTKQPVLTISPSGNFLTYDGSDDYSKTPGFALVQPESVYFAGSQVTWTAEDTFYDGDSLNTMRLRQAGVSPALLQNAGMDGSGNSGLAINTRGVVSAVFSGAASALRVNRGSPVASSIGTGSPNGFVLGISGNLVTRFANITASEIIIRSVADGTSVQDRLIKYLGRNNRIAV